MVKKSKNKFKNIKINLNISNRLLYSIIAVLVIVGIGAFVYAVTPNPGHAASEIGGLVNMYVDSTTKKLCYQNGSYTKAGCSLQQTTCTPKSEYQFFNDEDICSDSTQELQNEYCNEMCKAQSSCNGILPANVMGILPAKCSGGTKVYFDSGTRVSCTGGNPEDTLKCFCKTVSAKNYFKEILTENSSPTYRCL
jgi:hypothetical protein